MIFAVVVTAGCAVVVVDIALGFAVVVALVVVVAAFCVVRIAVVVSLCCSVIGAAVVVVIALTGSYRADTGLLSVGCVVSRLVLSVADVGAVCVVVTSLVVVVSADVCVVFRLVVVVLLSDVVTLSDGYLSPSLLLRKMKSQLLLPLLPARCLHSRTAERRV